MNKFVIGQVLTKEGVFTLKGKRIWLITDDVFILSDGTICWRMLWPEGLLIQYPDKTKRFVSHTEYQELDGEYKLLRNI